MTGQMCVRLVCYLSAFKKKKKNCHIKKKGTKDEC